MHIPEEDLKAYLLGLLPSSRELALESHVLECKACEDRLVQAASDRQSPVEPGGHQQEGALTELFLPIRFQAGEPVVVHVLLPFSARSGGWILEASQDRMKLRLSQRLEPGTLVQVYSSSKIAMAEVRHCLALGAEFQIDVQLQDVIRIPRRGDDPS